MDEGSKRRRVLSTPDNQRGDEDEDDVESFSLFIIYECTEIVHVVRVGVAHSSFHNTAFFNGITTTKSLQNILILDLISTQCSN